MKVSNVQEADPLNRLGLHLAVGQAAATLHGARAARLP